MIFAEDVPLKKEDIFLTEEKIENSPENKEIVLEEVFSNEYIIEKVENIMVQFQIENFEFELQKAQVLPKYQEKLDKIIPILQEYHEIHLKILGHTDSTGSMKLNEKLSYERALSVKNYFVKKGISSSRLSLEGVASTFPLATNQTKEGRPKNRCVEFSAIVIS